jgi:hypothetical protein
VIYELKDPTTYRVTRKNCWHPYTIRAVDPYSGKWRRWLTVDDINFAAEWLKSKGQDLADVMVNDGGTRWPKGQPVTDAYRGPLSEHPALHKEVT